MITYDRILRNEMAIDCINAMIYGREKTVKEYGGLIKQYAYSPNKKYQQNINTYVNVKLKAMEEIVLLKKIKKNLVKANIRLIKEISEEYRELRLPEIRSLFNAIDNLN